MRNMDTGRLKRFSFEAQNIMMQGVVVSYATHVDVLENIK
jgi:hypothetical protein